MNTFVEYQKFPSAEIAIELISILDENKISYQVDDKGLGYSIISNPFDNFIIVKIQRKNIKKVNELTQKQEQLDYNDINEDHYLYTFSDKDIIDVIANPSEWTKIEIRLANEIAKQRKLELSAENINSAKIKKLKEIVREEQDANNKVKNTANWFGAIAIFSVINTILLIMNIEVQLIFGLGITQVADGVIYSITGELGIYNILTSSLLSIIFVLFWYFARKKQNWAFIVGTAVYTLDTFLFFFVKDWLSLGFHLFVIIGIISGYFDLLESKNKEAKQTI